MTSLGARALFDTLFAIDPRPDTIGATYAELVRIGKRECPDCHQTMLMDGVHVSFTLQPDEEDRSRVFEVIVFVHIKSVGRYQSPTAVTVTMHGTIDSAYLASAEDVTSRALALADVFRRRLLRWGWME